MTDCELLQMLANGYTVVQISTEKNINRRTLEKRIIILRDRCCAKTVTELVAKYFRLNLIS
jgi:DNA-binding NarL/FixJ family response regulator